MKRGIEYRMQLGEIKNLKGNFLEKRLRISYAGQYSSDRYSIAIIITFGNNSYAYNIYFGSHQKDIIVPYGKLSVIEVDEQSLYFMFRPE